MNISRRGRASGQTSLSLRLRGVDAESENTNQFVLGIYGVDATLSLHPLCPYISAANYRFNRQLRGNQEGKPAAVRQTPPSSAVWKHMLTATCDSVRSSFIVGKQSPGQEVYFVLMRSEQLQVIIISQISDRTPHL